MVEYDPGFRARMAYVRSWKCQYCNEDFVSEGELLSHLETPHGIGQSRIHLEHSRCCIKCTGDLLSKADLLRHAHEQQDRPYGCSCGVFFSRIDVLNRHLTSLGNDVPQYPCTFCKRHRGEEDFRRKNHLLQHLRQYHRHEIDTSTGTANSDARYSSSRVKYQFAVRTHSDCPS